MPASKGKAVADAVRNDPKGTWFRIPSPASWVPNENGLDVFVHSDEKPPYRQQFPYPQLSRKKTAESILQVRSFHATSTQNGIGMLKTPMFTMRG